MTLVSIGIILIALAVAVILMAAASVNGINQGWAAPLFIGGLLIAIVGAVLRR